MELPLVIRNREWLGFRASPIETVARLLSWSAIAAQDPHTESGHELIARWHSGTLQAPARLPILNGIVVAPVRPKEKYLGTSRECVGDICSRRWLVPASRYFPIESWADERFCRNQWHGTPVQ